MSSNRFTSYLPVLSLLVGASLWGAFWYPLRLLQAHGLPGVWSSLVMYSAVAAVSAPWLWGMRAVAARRPGLLAALALAAGWCNVSFILAVIDGSVVRVLLLFYLSPLWATLLARLLLGERLHARVLLTLAVAMAGALIMLWHGAPESGGAVDALVFSRSDWLAVSSGFSFALSNVLVRMGDDLPVAIKTIVVWWGGALVAGAWLLLAGASAAQFSVAPVVAAMALGWCGIAAMTWAVQYGVTHMPVQRSAVILLFELVAGAVSSQWLAGEVIGAREWLGGVLIIAAGYFSAMGN